MTEELNIVYDEFKEANSKTVSHFEIELSKIRAGKASPVMLQTVMVDYYGSPAPLSQVANINTMDARTITVQPWEKAMIDPIMKGIINSNLGFAPQSNGESVLISVPPLTEDRRKELVKRSKSEGENAKVGIRNNRREALDMIKAYKADGLSEDLVKDAEIQIQTITNSFSSRIDDVLVLKEKEILTI
jgi:ribosome recycling factor